MSSDERLNVRVVVNDFYDASDCTIHKSRTDVDVSDEPNVCTLRQAENVLGVVVLSGGHSGQDCHDVPVGSVVEIACSAYVNVSGRSERSAHFPQFGVIVHRAHLVAVMHAILDTDIRELLLHVNQLG